MPCRWGLPRPIINSHAEVDLFDQIWRKGVPFGRLVQKFSTASLQAPEIYNFPLENAVFRKNHQFAVVVAS